ncbi:hypothetical protein ACLOJK_011125 [Asimina triloba]
MLRQWITLVSALNSEVRTEMALMANFSSFLPSSYSFAVRASAASSNEKKGKSTNVRDDWRKRSRPIPPGGTYPAKDHCSSRTNHKLDFLLMSLNSQCGLCDTYYIAHVKNACAFLGDGMSRIESLEPLVHGRGRNADSLDDTYFGVHEELLYARKREPVQGAQWTGIVTTIAVEMLKANIVEAVVCVQSDPEDRLTPMPVLARTPDEVLAARGVKPTLSPNLNTLALVEVPSLPCLYNDEMEARITMAADLDRDRSRRHSLTTLYTTLF